MNTSLRHRLSLAVLGLLAAIAIAIPSVATWWNPGSSPQSPSSPTAAPNDPVEDPADDVDDPDDGTAAGDPPDESGPDDDRSERRRPWFPWPRPPWYPQPGPTPSPTPDPEPEPEPEPVEPRTFVSLTFDDGNADQLAAAALLDPRGLDATFYVNSGTIGTTGHLSLDDLRALSAAGHEIGGHTVTHPDLVGLPSDEVARQVCDDRSRLLGWGFAVRSFAYPFASTEPSTESVVESCGYNSARMLGDVRSRFGCPECDAAESIPPANPYYTRALDQFDSSWTLQDMKDVVEAAEETGGWLQFTFHDLCTTSCGELAVSESLFTQFLDWLAPRADTVGTVVRTVGEVVGGPVKPAVAGPVVPPPSGSGNAVVNAGLEQVSNGVPVCWMQAPWGDNEHSFGLVSPGRSGQVASRIVMSSHTSGDAKIIPTFDLGACAPSVSAGSAYALSAWYTSTTVTQFAVYLRTESDAWVYWTSSPWFAPASEFTEAAWTTPPIPPGHDGISFGLNIFSVGELVTDDYAIYDASSEPLGP